MMSSRSGFTNIVDKCEYSDELVWASTVATFTV